MVKISISLGISIAILFPFLRIITTGETIFNMKLHRCASFFAKDLFLRDKQAWGY
jgi:hypothetical protein